MNKRLIKVVIVVIGIFLLVNVPILHQDIQNQKINFSIVDSIKMDFAEKQFLTGSFIVESVRDMF